MLREYLRLGMGQTPHTLRAAFRNARDIQRTGHMHLTDFGKYPA